MKKLKIAFDGPAAGGKSTIAKEVAKRLNYVYIDTGAMYRAVTYKALVKSCDFGMDEQIIGIAKSYPVEFTPSAETFQGYRIFIDNEDVTDRLTSESVNMYVSDVAKISDVRKILVARQKSLAEEGGVVMAGRDITTVVMPDAQVKIYLTASEEERARRRYAEEMEKGVESNIDKVKENIKLRDTIDSSREDSPLMLADDAVYLDSTGKSIEKVVSEVMDIVRERLN